MTISEQETATHINYLETIRREIAIEGDLQKSTIATVFRPHIPNIINDLRLLNKYRKKYGELVLEDARESHASGT